MTLSFRNGVSIGEIIVYTFALAIAIFLAIRHGFGKSSGWVYLIVFCLARLIGPAMELATINDPTNTDLYTGYAILNNVGLSPLLLAALGFLSRLLDNIHKSHTTMLSPRILRIVQLVIVVGLILGIVGGINASEDYTNGLKNGKGGSYHPGTLSKAGTALFIVSYVATVAFTIAISFSVPHAEAGEKRLFIAVAVALPFLLVRLVYSCMSTFTTNHHFNLLTGSITTLLCMAFLMELCVVINFEFMGLSLRRPVQEHHAVATRQVGSSDSSQPLQKKSGAGNMALNIAKKTIIGRIVTALVSRGETHDVEMQDQSYIAK